MLQFFSMPSLRGTWLMPATLVRVMSYDQNILPRAGQGIHGQFFQGSKAAGGCQAHVDSLGLQHTQPGLFCIFRGELDIAIHEREIDVQ
jgi:hypothetical protein